MNKTITLILLIAACQIMIGCVASKKQLTTADYDHGFVSIMDGSVTTPNSESSNMYASRTKVDQIDSFNPKVACEQALEVVNNNPYDQQLFENVFATLVELGMNSKSPDNAEIIWQNFVEPLHQNGKVPPDLATSLWNYHFSKQFASLPDSSSVNHYCRDLPAIRKNIESEYQMKKQGFEITRQGAPETHFLNAMYVYNTMWANCNNLN